VYYYILYQQIDTKNIYCSLFSLTSDSYIWRRQHYLVPRTTQIFGNMQ